MKESMLYLTDDSVRAVLRSVDPKTQTRRIVKLPHNNPLGVWEPFVCGGPDGGRTARGETISEQGGIWHTRTADCLMCPYGEPGDRLWVREAWRTMGDGGLADRTAPCNLSPSAIWYEADGVAPLELKVGRYRPARFMPRWASRITLEIASVRVERLLDISAEDAIAEGILRWNLADSSRVQKWQCPPHLRQSGEGDSADVVLYEGWPVTDSREAYLGLWDSLNFKRGYGRHVNPFVWRIEFRRVAP